MTGREKTERNRRNGRRFRRYAGRYARYLAQQSVVLPTKMLLFMLFVCSVLALVGVGLMALCLPICGTGWDVAFLLLGMVGAFLTLLTVSAGLHQAVDYVIMQPAGHFLNPVPPLRDEHLSDSDILVRASAADASAHRATLLRVPAYSTSEEAKTLLRVTHGGEGSAPSEP